MIGDNPAARLLVILEEGKNHASHANCRSVWKKLLQLEAEPDSVLMSRLGKVMELPDQIITILKKDFPNQSSTTSHWSNQVNNAFSQQNLNGQWAEFSTHIDVHTIMYLRLSADLIQTKSPTNLIDPLEVKELREKVSELLAELLESDFNPEFKEYLARCLQKMLMAIDEYRISGALPIMDTIEGAFGHAFFNAGYKQDLSNTKFGSKVFSVLSSVADTMTLALGVPMLPQAFGTYIELIKST